MSTKNILLSGGRAPATLELARLLAAQGHVIYVMESVPHHVCQHSRFVKKSVRAPSPQTDPAGFHTALVQCILQENIDVLIPTCEEIFTVSQKVDLLSSLCHCWIEPLPRLDSLHNKWSFIQEAKGLASHLPHTIYLQSWNEAEETLARYPTTDWILKPVYSRFSVGVQDLCEKKPTPAFITSKQPWILQEKIKGRQVCTYSLAHQGRLLLHSAYTTPYTAGKGGGILFEPYQNIDLQHSIAKWIKEKNWTGHLSFDWIEDEHGAMVPIECNPRLTSGIHLFQEEDRIDTAFTTPEKASRMIVPKKPHKKMLTLGMVIYGLRSCTSMNQLISWCKMMIIYQDVVFRLNDPGPIYSQLRSLWYFWKQSKKRKISLLKASTEDVEWNGKCE